MDISGNNQNRMRMRPKTALTLHGVLVAFLAVGLIQLAELSWFPLMIVSVLFLFSIWFGRASVFYVFVACILFLAIAGAPVMGRESLRRLDLGDLVFAMFLVGFIGASFRYIGLSRLVQTFCRNSLSESGTEIPNTQSNFQFPMFVGGRWWLIPVAVVLAALLLGIFPVDSVMGRQFWITPIGVRMIVLFGFLFFIWMICRSLNSLAMRWNMTPEQADVQVRSIVAAEFWKDQSGIEIRQAKIGAKNRQV